MDSRAWLSSILLCVTIHTYQCLDYVSYNYETDKGLSEPFFLNLTIPDMFSCFSLCQQINKCDSVSFDTNNKVCEMNANNSTSGSLSARTGYLFSDVTASSTLVGGCATSSCADEDICILDNDGNMSGCSTVKE
ncbi:uncharacterized protein LOC117345206 [Pecten maximus]|uniref:uncharacterized protein LOC117345206 n=1 Tax=Pecten maximus TaxID=6579 RepID=UPI001458BE1E|nr:uncharacterized protein LOC117345206 [Pecten maximus]XP_033764112.1 uncharacterized protein LOC117345206 [Pecten maximus]XP_033764113.1 uncharacterized protein LOC117345206 [Pecten maximus]XP_033764114.1 uncharacterized protein LOC117345206 [Pecten maximus]XP_033764115.1 uncharacterized protein LOC117345206 [Pecten maximus]